MLPNWKLNWAHELPITPHEPSPAEITDLVCKSRLEVLRQNTPGDLEVAIDPEELEGLDEAGVKALYNARVEEERVRNKREDFSDMVAQHNAAAKRKAASKDAGRQAKKSKETFKF